jgi:hypothetical protein
MKIYEKIKNITLLRNPEPVVIYVQEEDLITDEIEKSLLEIKEALDIPTEEIEMSIASRRNFKNIIHK